MLSYKPTCEITIGNYLFNKYVSAVGIRSSWKELTDTATITLPRNMYVMKEGQMVEFNKEFITDNIKKGDPVEIRLGYNGQNTTEFKGYVREPEAGTPFVIHCEDEMMLLKKQATTVGFESVSLVNLVNHVAPNYNRIVPEGVEFGKYTIHNATPAKVLESLKDFNLFAWFDLDKTLHVGFPYADQFNKHIYSFQQNVRENHLKFKKADYTSLLVKAIANRKTGKKEVYEFGDPDGEVRTLNYGDISSSQLKQFAEAEVKRFKFDGYQGDITGWGWPVTRHGDVIEIRDSRYPERTGSYLVDAVTITWDDSGYKRVNTLGPRV